MSPAKKILVIDDEEKVQELVLDILLPHGYTMYSARNGEEGVAKAKEIIPNLILLDIMMPIMDGFKVQETLKEDKSTEHIPIVFITAKTSLHDTMRAMSSGAAGYIEKPFDVKRLLRKVKSLLA